MFISLPSIRFRLRVAPQKNVFRSFFRLFARCANFASTRKVLKRKFGSSRSISSKNRRDRSYPRDFRAVTSFPVWNTGIVLLGAQHMSCVEHRKCFAWNTGNPLLGIQEKPCLGHRKCFAWNTRSVLLGTQELSCWEHRKCF